MDTEQAVESMINRGAEVIRNATTFVEQELQTHASDQLQKGKS